MFNTFFEALYNKVLVTIVVKRASSDVYIEVLSKKNVLSHLQKNFATLSLSAEMIEYIKGYTKESPYYYIALLNMSVYQGALVGCEKKKLQEFAEKNVVQYMCHEKRWAYYCDKESIKIIMKSYKETGCDYIFSPYSLLVNFFKDKVNGSTAMFVLMQDSFVTVVIFEQNELLFAEHLDMQITSENDDEILSQEIESDENLDFSDEDGIDLEDVNVLDDMEELEDLDAFGDIEDLDSIEDIDEFSDNKDIEEEFNDTVEEFPQEKENSFNEDYQRFSLIHGALGNYYADEEAESKFIENVYIADSVGVGNDFKRYLEEELFLNVYIRQANLGVQLAQLVKIELSL